MFRLVKQFTLLALFMAIGFSALAKVTPVDALAVSQQWASFLSQSPEHVVRQQLKYKTCFTAAAKQYDIPLTLLVAVARGESNFNRFAVSHANAIGVMQIKWPETAHDLEIYRRSDLFKPCLNIRAGARYLRKMLDRYSGDVHLALAAYNYGPGRIPVGAGAAAIPTGAAWYSGYILNHFLAVIGETPLMYADAPVHFSQKTLIAFNSRLRAEAYMRFLLQHIPTIDLALEKKSYRYIVKLRAKDERSRDLVLLRLKRLGFINQI